MKEEEGSSQGTCTKGPWTKTMGRVESGRWGMNRTWESNGRKIGATIIEITIKNAETS